MTSGSLIKLDDQAPKSLNFGSRDPYHLLGSHGYPCEKLSKNTYVVSSSDEKDNGTIISHVTYPSPYTSDLDDCFGSLNCENFNSRLLINFTDFDFGPEPQKNPGDPDEVPPFCR